MTTVTQPDDDARLVARSLAGDAEAFRGLVERHQGRVFACARAVLRSEADAADVTQDVFIRFHRHLVQFDPRRPLAPYLLRIAVNRARDLLRERSRHDEVTEDALAAHPDARPNPGETLMAAELAGRVRTLVAELPQTLREVCSLFYLSECSCAEVAAILGMREGAVKVALHRARKKLLHTLIETEAAHGESF
jgi:RNA polymerase sigma-70 factor (ECF subfamily)